MKTVLVIGAGGTRAQASKAPLKRRPPLDGDFFKIARAIDAASTKGPRRNNSLFSVGSDLVVPLGEIVIFLDGQCLHFCVGNLYALLIAPFDQSSTDTQTRTGCGCTGVLEDGLEAVQRATCPVFAEFAEQAVLDRIPLRCTGRVMRDGDGETVAIAQTMLESVLPGAAV